MDKLDIGHGAKIYFRITFFDRISINITQTTVTLFVTTVLLMILAYALTRNLKLRPSRRQVIVEKLVSMLYDLVESTMGTHNLKYAPYIGTLFLSSFFGTLLGMTQILRSVTADLMVTLGWALITTGLCWYESIKNNGFLGWLKGFTEPVVVMTPMNIISEIAQPFSMAFRLFGNISGGNVLTAIIYAALASLSTALFSWLPEAVVAMIPPVFQIGIPAFLSIYFDLFSAFVQSFVFSLLTMVYVGTCNPPPAEPKDEKATKSVQN